MAFIIKSFIWLSLMTVIRANSQEAYENELLSQLDLDLSLNSRCLKPRGQFPAASCQSFVNCWDGVAIEQPCPDGLLFNPSKFYCDHPENVNCGSATNPLQLHSSPIRPSNNQIGTENSQDTTLNRFCLKQIGIFPGRSCNRFVHCWGGNVIELSCPDGLHFSKLGFCDYPVSAGCDDSDFPERNVQEQSPCPQESGIFRNESHCDRYFVCSFGRILSQYQCPPGFSFSKILGTCDYSHRVDCGDALQLSNVENSTVLNLTHPSTDVTEKSSESDPRCSVVPKGYVRDSTNCSQYHLCESGVVTATYTCPTDTLYSNVLGICDFANKVNCNDSVTASEVNNIDIGQDLSPELLAAVEKCTPGTTIPLNADCSKACRCRAHSAEIIQCTQGLAYDSALDKCVPSYIAKC